MLRDELGRSAFDAGLQRFWKEKRFQRASWDDLLQAFEQASGRELGVFFTQWIERTGAPSVTVELPASNRQVADFGARDAYAR